jgi:hypothetical protein
MSGIQWIGPNPVPTRESNSYQYGAPGSWGKKNYRCSMCSADVESGDRSAHEAFHANYVHADSIQNGRVMSNVLWCDYGDHAFKAGAPGSGDFEGTYYAEDGTPVREKRHACGEHNPMNAPKVAQKELPVYGSPE